MKEYLKEQSARGTIEVGFSWPIISELIQDFDEEHRHSRVRRAEVLKEVCGTNAFCHPTEFHQGPVFSYDGYWFPNIQGSFDIRTVEAVWIKQIGANKQLIPNRSQRNALKNVKHRRRALRQIPQLADLTKADLGLMPLTDKFVKGQYLFRFMVGEISEAEANRELLKIVTDPVLYIVSWFDMAGKTNTFTKEMHSASAAMEEKFVALRLQAERARESIEDMKAIERDMYREKMPLDIIRGHKQIRSKLSKKLEIEQVIKPDADLWQILGHHTYEVFIAYVKERLDPSGMKSRRSDFADILHAAYIPHCDLWRGDSPFANMLIKRSISLSDRIVPKLTDLPNRIEQFREPRIEFNE
ncbi:hypothetical protein [Pelagibius sp.]|uniref:hypothetical protein n=1 Tax=Pelagibius sp. TaxID=1931238 RepID=UPI0026232E8B|nr:hypothetical protein [Pelagibius sp.]